MLLCTVCTCETPTYPGVYFLMLRITLENQPIGESYDGTITIEDDPEYCKAWRLEDSF
jgi:hypothetical protein